MYTALRQGGLPHLTFFVTLSYCSKAASAHVLRLLAERSGDLADIMMEKQVVHSLLVAMGTTAHLDSQRQAARLLSVLIQGYPEIEVPMA